MIYACLKFLQEWHTPLTLVNFVLLGTGLRPHAAMCRSRCCAHPQFAGPLALAAVRARRIRLARAHRDARPQMRACALKSTMASAIGIAHPSIAAEGAGLHGRLVQHARVLPRPA